MPAKPKAKRPASPYLRRGLVTARDPFLGCREAKYILDIDDLETEMVTTLRRIRDRDGKKWFKEGALFPKGKPLVTRLV